MEARSKKKKAELAKRNAEELRKNAEKVRNAKRAEQKNRAKKFISEVKKSITAEEGVLWDKGIFV